MSEEKKTHAEEFDAQEREGAVQYLAFTGTIALVTNPSFKALCNELSRHLQDHHGFDKPKAEKEVLALSAEALNLVIEAILAGGEGQGKEFRLSPEFVQAIGAEEFMLQMGARRVPKADPKKGN